MGLQTKETLLSQLDEDIARMEAEGYGPAEQEEQVLDGENAIAPEEPLKVDIESTEDLFTDGTAPEDTQKPLESEVIAQLRKELADEKHRFGRYKGSTDRTIHQLRTELAGVNDQVVSLKKLTAELKQTTTPSVVDTAFNQDVVDILGEEVVDAIKTTVKSAEDKTAELDRKLAEQDIQQHEKRSNDLRSANSEEFMSKLVELVPDVSTMDGDPDFNEWLRQPGPDGIERLIRLRKDQDDLDAYRVAQFFNEYKSLKAKDESKATEVKDSVSNHIGPTGTQSASSNTMLDESQQGIVKQSEINQFNLEVNRGDYKYEPAKAEAMEAKIFKAMQEGKILMDANPI